MTRWASFIIDLDPNPAANSDAESGPAPKLRVKGVRGVADHWPRYTKEGEVYAIGEGKVAPCSAAWGSALPYDWQLWP